MPVQTLSQVIQQPLHRVVTLVRGEWARGGATGFCETLLRLAGVAWRYPAHRRWLGILSGTTTRRLLEVYPRITLRHSTPYLFAGAPWRQRLQLLSVHYAFFNRALEAAFFERMIAGPGVCLWRLSLEQRTLAVWLRGPCLKTRHREGEASLNLSVDDALVATLAFSVVPAAALRLPAEGAAPRSPLLIYIGQVQGAPGRFELWRAATRTCAAVAPHDLLMSALAGVAAAWGIDGLLGVPAALQLSAGSLAHSPSRFDYDAFWRRYRAIETAAGHAFIALPWAEKPIEEIAAKHRGRTLRKRAFRQAVAEAVCDSVRCGAA